MIINKKSNIQKKEKPQQIAFQLLNSTSSVANSTVAIKDDDFVVEICRIICFLV